MAGFTPLTGDIQMQGSQFFDPQALAQLQTDQMRLQQRQQLAQSLMQGGYVPNSGKAGVLTSVLSSLAGGLVQRQNNEKITDLLKRQLEAAGQAETAKRKQQVEDENRKLQQEIIKAQQTEKAKRDYAPSQFQAAGVFDPSTGTYTPSAAAAQQEIGIKGAEADASARATARYREAPGAGENAALMNKIALAQKMGASQADIMRMVTGQKGSEAPAGYQPDGKGGLAPIPGGPADTTKERAVPADQAGKVALADEYLQNFPGIAQSVKAGELTGVLDNLTTKAGYGHGGEVRRQILAGRDALQRTLTGAGMPASEAAEYAGRYLPTAGDTAETLMSKQEQLKTELKNFSDVVRNKQSTPEGMPAQPDQSAIMAELKRRGVM